ncbi:MAG: S8 family serine peptidase [Candidatus Eremiobacterota bacterium]
MMALSQLREALALPLSELVTRAHAPVEVAVLDSGVDATHADLAGRVVAAYNVVLADGVPAVQEIASNTNNDGFGHGTAVASIICRLAPNARIVDVRVLGGSPVGAGAAMVLGLEEALKRRSRLVNISLAASAKFSQTLWGLCEKAYRANQIVVASRRNMPLHDDGFPAEFSNCISVDREHFESPFKIEFRDDQTIEFAAHGDDVVAAAPGGGYTTMTGTSFATPTITGIVALLLGTFPELRLFEVKSILKANAL